MSWGGGTDIFNRMCKEILHEKSAIHPGRQFSLIFELIDALEDADWDGWQESKWYKHPVVRSVLKNLHPDWDWSDEDA